MNIYEHLLPGKENALTPEYLATKYHFSSVRMLIPGWQIKWQESIKGTKLR